MSGAGGEYTVKAIRFDNTARNKTPIDTNLYANYFPTFNLDMDPREYIIKLVGLFLSVSLGRPTINRLSFIYWRKAKFRRVIYVITYFHFFIFTKPVNSIIIWITKNVPTQNPVL